MNTIYIILSTLGIGGAEKRFSELWLKMQVMKQGHIKFVLPKVTYEKLIAIDELSSIASYKQNIVLLNWSGGNYIKKRKMLKQFVQINRNNNAVFHFIMDYPIFLNFSSKNTIIYTYAATSFSQMNFKGKLSIFMAMLEAKKIDILDPQLTLIVKKILFWKRGNIYNTPGSFVDLNKYHSLKFNKKKNWLVFLGRFEPVKQIIEFVNSIPHIDRFLKKNGITDPKFYILGSGSLERAIEKIISKEIFNGIKINVYFENQPIKIFKKSKVFFSLQKYSNYPSKSLLEAIACGNLPIVTNNGDTQKIADPCFSYFVNEKFTPQELAEHCLKILLLDNNIWETKCELIKNHLKEHFAISKSLEYFNQLYKFDR